VAIWTKHTNTNNTMNYRDLEPEAALAELQQEPAPRLLDVRTEPEHRSHRLPNSVLVPVQELAQRFCELDAQDNWFVYCEHGRRSLFACDILANAGFTKLTNIRGGMAHWAGRGLPFERPSS
jgi:rhodanese-related sulfurtransferase